MRFLAFIIICALSLSSYCAAAHAFGEMPMQSKTEKAIAKDMPDCHGIKADPSNSDKGDHHPAKSGVMNCKACCAALVGFLAMVVETHIASENIKFADHDRSDQSDVCFPIFHPPKSSV